MLHRRTWLSGLLHRRNGWLTSVGHGACFVLMLSLHPASGDRKASSKLCMAWMGCDLPVATFLAGLRAFCILFLMMPVMKTAPAGLRPRRCGWAATSSAPNLA